jgi:hypothetical protein
MLIFFVQGLWSWMERGERGVEKRRKEKKRDLSEMDNIVRV